LDPKTLRPIGDRYLVEVVPVDEELTPAGIYLPEKLEEQRGWAVGIVFSVGNGHRLETPDQVTVIPEGYVPDPKLNEAAQIERRTSALGYRMPALGDHSSVMRFESAVPMFFIPGEVIFIERYSGRQFTIQGRTFRFVNQVDCLGTSGVYLKLAEDGINWEERDIAAEQAEAQKQQAEHEARVKANGRIHRP
jgi:co-chaperonin GroES (HSP10)